ncbi:uroporphyrinogen-III synthase [Balneicella halophila]|uniref:Uroporphyrinogen-III synthase n=1 Tax=Balneicella halophila TaxID=1537566 RepID=A0A7L4USD7_BALHA|nr:uroporphyrinogen-III synthase [Balneicella halophila]PVX51884.1 uroporphyrinogen-III synthase [Balneicella halophila]
MKIKNILVSQPEPRNGKSPYLDLANENNVKIDFRTFIEVKGVDTRDFRKQKINLADFQSVIFTSRTAIDHYFRIAEQMRYTVPDTMKYFCTSESVALYLQKYIQYRKRKIFYGQRTIEDLLPTFKKHKNDAFLLPLSDIHKDTVPNFLEKHKLKYTKAILYRTVSSNLSDLGDLKYDVLVFYSPSGIKSLFENFPNFEQKDTLIASFGTATADAVEKAGLRLDIKAPSPKAPSMTMALEQYIKAINSNNKK